MKNAIYADINSCRPLLEKVKKTIRDRLDENLFADPFALHAPGRTVRDRVESSRRVCATALGAKPENVFFTSGITEANASVFHTLLFKGPKHHHKNRIVISAIENEGIQKTAEWYTTKGFILHIVPVSQSGLVQNSFLRDLLEKFTGQIALFSVETAHSRTGILQPLESIVRLCETFSAPIYSDTSAAVGKIPFHFLESGLDYAVVSGTRLGALPGSGILLVQDPPRFAPILFRAREKPEIREGILDVLGIESLAAALEDLSGSVAEFTRIAAHRERFETRMLETFPALFIAGKESPRLPNTTLLGYPGIHGQALQIELESRGVYVGLPAGIRDNEITSPAFLQAMGTSEEIARSAVSISIAPATPENDYALIENALKAALDRLKRIGAFTSSAP